MSIAANTSIDFGAVVSRRERHRQHRRQLAILRGMRSDNVLVGPRVYLTGSSIEAGVFIARLQTARSSLPSSPQMA